MNTIYFQDKRFVQYGKDFHYIRHTHGAGKHSDRKIKNIFLHRAIWESTNGPIPSGMFIHHKDFNPTNNDISNLELVTRQQHDERHKEDKSNRGKTKKQLIHLEKIRPLTLDKHSTEDTRRAAKILWSNKEKKKYTCLFCKKEYWSITNHPTKFCSSKHRCLYRYYSLKGAYR